MDRLFISFILVGVLLALGVVLYESLASASVAMDPKVSAASTTTTSTPTSSTSASTSTSTSLPADPSPTSSTTTTVTTSSTVTLPSMISVEVFNMEKCRQTVYGKMNTILVNISNEKVAGNWGPEPDPRFGFVCDDGVYQPFEMIMYRGGKNIGSFGPVEGEYRMSVKCGRNRLVDDLIDCRELDVLLESSSINSTSYQGRAAASSLILSTSTSTTLSRNPYLDKFRGLGYRKASMQVKWLCPSCVPGVNKLIGNEVGVKSKSMTYKQDPCYIIYDPGLISLDRVLQIAGAGGDVSLYNDTEI
ncbi:hypothetical protein ACFLRF_00420 [Candidatus Altiarchaeota archaeon]